MKSFLCFHMGQSTTTTTMKKWFVQDVFQDVPPSSFLEKIQDYHDETGLPIMFSLRKNHPSWNYPSETKWLRTMETRLLPHHQDLVRQYLPTTVFHRAQDAYLRSQYYRYKLQTKFLQHAIQQIQEYDPFFLTMDDVHHSDMMMMGLISKQQFYQEKIMHPIRNKTRRLDDSDTHR